MREAERRSLFHSILIEQVSVPALNTCVKMLREGDERAKALLLLALLDIYQSNPMRVNVKEPVELEPMKKIDEIRRFSTKEMRLSKKSMGALPRSSEYCGPIRKKSRSYVSGIIGMAYNLFLNEDIRDCFFYYEQAVLLRFWTLRMATIRSAANQQTKLGLVLEEKVNAPSVPECVRLARMSEKSYELLCRMFSAVPQRTKEELESILGKKFMGYASGNFSDFERQKQKGSTVTDYKAVDENDEVQRVMMEVEPLLEASGKRNWRSILSTHDNFPFHCLLQSWWYPGRSNLVLIWDCGELLSMGLPDSSQPITIVIVEVMMAIRWLEAQVKQNNRQEAPTKEQLQELDCLKTNLLVAFICCLKFN